MDKIEQKLKKVRLPNKLIAFKNEDKAFHEKWFETRNMLNIPHPSRFVIMGPPNVGKSTSIKNLILRQQPEFEEIVVIHCDAEHTKEYQDITDNLLSEIPDASEWNEDDVKMLVILDDLEFKQMSKDQKRNLDRLFGYVSTHKNVSVMLCAQDCFNVPPIVRRCANVWVLWRTNDLDSLSNVARKSGIPTKKFKYLFDKYIHDTHDSLWIDRTSKTPYPLRKNGFEIIHE